MPDAEELPIADEQDDGIEANAIEINAPDGYYSDEAIGRRIEHREVNAELFASMLDLLKTTPADDNYATGVGTWPDEAREHFWQLFVDLADHLGRTVVEP